MLQVLVSFSEISNHFRSQTVAFRFSPKFELIDLRDSGLDRFSNS